MTIEQEITAQKKALRKAMRIRRAEYQKKNPDAAMKVRDLLLENTNLPPSSIVAMTLAQSDELDPMPTGLALMKSGHSLCLPCVEENKTLTFRIWKPGDPTKAGALKILEPLPLAPATEPSVLLLPLLAFDQFGNRLGQGGGYYDRTLAHLRNKSKIMAIGLAYDIQEVQRVPAKAADEPLDAIITDRRIIWPPRP